MGVLFPNTATRQVVRTKKPTMGQKNLRPNDRKKPTHSQNVELSQISCPDAKRHSTSPLCPPTTPQPATTTTYRHAAPVMARQSRGQNTRLTNTHATKNMRCLNRNRSREFRPFQTSATLRMRMAQLHLRSAEGYFRWDSRP